MSEAFYWEIVRPIIARRLPQLLERHAAGLIGYGSDVLGHDDDLSTDHEWGARCHLWLQESDYQDYAGLLNQALDEELPMLFKGQPARFSLDDHHQVLVPYNGNRNIHHVAITTVKRHKHVQLGVQTPELSTLDWLVIPEQKLLEWTRGRIFTDPVEEITELRKVLSYFPDDIWRFKLKYAWNSLQPLYIARLADRRGDSFSARLAINRMAEKVVQLIFLYNRKYRPGTYKWISRELLQSSPLAERLAGQLESAVLEADVSRAVELIESVLNEVVDIHNKLGVTGPVEPQASVPLKRGMQSYSYDYIEQALLYSLPEELQHLEIPGAVDQFVTGDDLLIWADHYTKFKPVFQMKSDIERNGIGDMIV
ncbi:DUF4037 domain-containing protein [Paenibacillus tengchongensis]|uniref:DUF4037 domain-containing protein n=1 Tax=Paenibacillus tengchongensis TaxID=2608684 RepID=UPI001651DE42|nr:DUF4037 domain-containing protein [Paenibacillus tengchongensis]